MNSAIVPSLVVIGGIGAHRSGFLTAARKLVMTTSAPRGTVDQVKQSFPDDPQMLGNIAKWGGGIAGLSAILMIVGSGDGSMSDLAGAFAVLTAFGMSISYGPDFVKALTATPMPTSATAKGTT